MSHYDIQYTDLDSQETQEKAIQDIKEWVGEERFADIEAHMRRISPAPSLAWFRLATSFAGISGYPVKVWYDRLWP